MLRLQKFKNKKICILGLGIENQALVRFLLDKKISCEITICDALGKKQLDEKYSVIARDPAQAGERSNPVNAALTTGLLRRLSPPRNDKIINWRFGKNYDKNLSEFDIIFRSPGYPLFNPNLIKAKKAGVEINSPMKLFFELCPTKNIIGVTGTKGKGTTASLINFILKEAGKKVWLGGNIGVAPFSFINKMKKNDWLVLELSSFQLEDITTSPHIAVITNFYKEHLASADPSNPNFHKTLADYKKAKLNIIKWQEKNDRAIINKRLFAKHWKTGAGKKIYFTNSNLLSKLAGGHNKENIAAAAAVAKLAGISQNIIKKAIAEFRGLEYRIEFVKIIKGVKYYNDSFATTPESTITALKSFSAPIILLGGGAEKKSDFKKLVKEIKKRVKLLILLKGSATLRLKKELLQNNYTKNKIKIASNMHQAIDVANKNSIAGDIILLSPACASFGMFKNYKDRGKKFTKEVKDRAAIKPIK